MSGLFSKLRFGSKTEANETVAAPADSKLSDNEYETSSIESAEKQSGVQKVEAIALTWTRTSLWIAYAG